MRITRQRLKQIIMEEVNLVEGTPDMVDLEADGGNAPANQGGMDEITEINDIMESESVELINQIAQAITDAGIVGTEDPKELIQALMGLGKMGTYMLGGGALAAAGAAGKEAISKLFGAHDDEVAADGSEGAPLEEEEGTLEGLITQAIKEELAQI